MLVLRALGAKIGRGTYISQKVFIDPLYPELLSIGDDVLIGTGVKIFFHEITPSDFKIGRVTIGRDTIVGAHAAIKCGVAIGAGCFIGAETPVYRDVPDGHQFYLNLPRITKLVNLFPEETETGD